MPERISCASPENLAECQQAFPTTHTSESKLTALRGIKPLSPLKFSHTPPKEIIVGLIQHTKPTIHIHLLNAFNLKFDPLIAELMADSVNEVALSIEVADEDVVFGRPAKGEARARHVVGIG